MRLLHYLEIENFKRFGDRQRIELDHPAVLIGPNNCGKTSAIQALALWSQAVRTWFEVRKQSTAKERTATALNRLNIVAVPVTRTRFFWHNTGCTPEVLRAFGYQCYPADDLFTQQNRSAVDETLAETLRDVVFDGNQADYITWCGSPADAARLIWEAQTKGRKLSSMAEEFFRRLAQKVGGGMLLKKGELHRLVPHAVLTAAAEAEVRDKLDLLQQLFEQARRHGETPLADGSEEDGG